MANIPEEENTDLGLLEGLQTSGNDSSSEVQEVATPVTEQANPNPATPDFAPSDSYLTDGAFVENRVAGLLEDPNNLLSQRMKANGLAASGSRGLQNTTMGATIGQTVLADKAIEIARPDAATQAQGDLTRQGAEYLAQREGQNVENQKDVLTHSGNIQGELSSQQAQQAKDIATLTASLTASNQEQHDNFLKTMAEMGYDSQESIALAGMINTQSNSLINNVGALLRDENIEITDNTTKWMSEFAYAGWESAANLFDLEIEVV